MRERRIKDYTKFVALSNSKDEGEIGKSVGGMGLGRKVRHMFVDIPIKHPSEMLSRLRRQVRNLREELGEKYEFGS